MKFHLVSSWLFLSATGFIIPHFNLIKLHLASDKTDNTIEKALRRLAVDTKDKPLIIPFLGKDATAIATKLVVRNKIQFAITQRNSQILTASVVKNIFFQNTSLSPSKVIKIKCILL